MTSYRPQLTSLFLLLFVLTVLVPITGLVFTTVSTLDTAKTLTRHTVNEYQSRYGAQLDGFLMDKYIPGLMQAASEQSKSLDNLLPKSVPAMRHLSQPERIVSHYCHLKKSVEEKWLHPLGFTALDIPCEDLTLIRDSPVRLHILEYFYGASVMDYADVISEVMDPKPDIPHSDPKVQDLANRMQFFQDTYRARRRLYEQLGIIQYPDSLLIRDESSAYASSQAPEGWREDLNFLFQELTLPDTESIEILASLLKIPTEQLLSNLTRVIQPGNMDTLTDVRDSVKILEKLRLSLIQYAWEQRDAAVTIDRERPNIPKDFAKVLHAVDTLTGKYNPVLQTALDEIKASQDLSRRTWELLPRALNLYRQTEQDWLSEYHDYGDAGNAANFRSTKIRPLHRIGHFGALEQYYKIADWYFSPEYDAYDLEAMLEKAGAQISSHDPLLNALHLILKFLLSGAVSHDLFMNSNRSMLIRRVMGVDAKDMIDGKYVLVRSGRYQVLVSTQHFPTSFNSNLYYRGIAEPPKAMCMTLGDRILIGKLFASFVNLPTTGTESYSNLIALGSEHQGLLQPMHADESVVFGVRQIHEELLQVKHGRGQEIPTLIQGFGWQLREFILPDTEVRARIRVGQEALFRKHSVVRLLPQSQANEWLQANQVQQGVLQRQDGRKFIISVIPSTAPMLQGYVYIMELSESVANQNLQWFLSIALLLAIIGVSGAIFFGRAMSKNMVSPLLLLRHKVKDYTRGILPNSDSQSRGRDEIALMDQNFHIMANTIEAKLSETEFLNNLNMRATRGESPGEILKDLFQRLAEIVKCNGLTAKFMERDNPSVVISTVQVSNQNLKSGAEIMLNNPFGQDNSSSGQLIGSMILCGGIWPPAATEQNFIQSLCSQAIAISSKAWLDKLKKDNVEGQEIQLSLMPTETPDIKDMQVSSSYVAARFLGGDFYDWVKNGEVFDVIVSDVSGKGVGAALFGSSCKSILRQLLSSKASPAQCLIELNDLLCEGKENSLFASLFLARFDLKTRILHYASAGHNKMILQHADSTMTYLSAKGLPLGMFSPGKYEDKSIQLQGDDLLCLYTDGITELEDPMLNLYGNERLESLLKANRHETTETIKQLLLSDLESYRASRPPSDDITLVLVKVT